MLRVVLLAALLLAPGCVTLPWDDHCGEVQRRSDGSWFLPTARASSRPPFAVEVESALWRDWTREYETAPCQMTVQEGVPSPWLGPVLLPSERDALAVILWNATGHNIAGGTWRLDVEASGAVAVWPRSWEGEVQESVRLALIVEAVEEGRGAVWANATIPSGGIVRAHVVPYLVQADAQGPPHRVG